MVSLYPPLKLGKKKPGHDSRTLRLANYLNVGALPTPPSELNLATKVKSWPMYANDVLGDCTIAAIGHMIELWTALSGKEVAIPVSAVTSVYKKLSPNDEGCVELDVLKYIRSTGIAGHKLFAFAALDLRNVQHIELALSLFGGVYLGIALPASAQAQTGPNKVWDVPKGGLHGSGAPGSWGGHAVNVVAYDATGLTIVTWGTLQRMTWAFWRAYVDEAWCLLTNDWAALPPVSGINFAALQSDLKQIGTVQPAAA